MPQKKQMYNWDFTLKNYQATRAKHAPQMRRLKQAGATYSQIVGYDFGGEVLSQAYTSGYFQHVLLKEKPSKSVVRNIKTLVNGTTYRMIQRSLEFYGYPKSWVTAFYITHKKKIDGMMRTVAKQLFSYVKQNYKNKMKWR